MNFDYRLDERGLLLFIGEFVELATQLTTPGPNLTKINIYKQEDIERTYH